MSGALVWRLMVHHDTCVVLTRIVFQSILHHPRPISLLCIDYGVFAATHLLLRAVLEFFHALELVATNFVTKVGSRQILPIF